MKTIVEKVEKVVGFEAMDGTRFSTQEECVKYEQSAKGVLKGRLMNLAINYGNEDSIYGTGCCDNATLVIKPKSVADIDLIHQFFLLSDGREDFFPKDLDKQIDKIIFVNIGYDDDYVWIDTMDALMARIMGDGNKQ